MAEGEDDAGTYFLDLARLLCEGVVAMGNAVRPALAYSAESPTAGIAWGVVAGLLSRHVNSHAGCSVDVRAQCQARGCGREHGHG